MVKSDTWNKHWEDEETSATLIGKRITSDKQEKLYEILYALADTHTILEIGSGEGHLTEVLENKAEGYELWVSQRFNYDGIDYSEKSVKICQDKGLNVRLADMFSINKKYDLVMSDGLLEHHLDFPKHIKKMCELSNKYVMVIQPDHQTFIIRLLLLLEKIFKPNTNVYEFNFRMSDYQAEFEQNGFELKSTNGVFFGGYKMLVFQKCQK